MPETLCCVVFRAIFLFSLFFSCFLVAFWLLFLVKKWYFLPYFSHYNKISMRYGIAFRLFFKKLFGSLVIPLLSLCQQKEKRYEISNKTICRIRKRNKNIEQICRR